MKDPDESQSGSEDSSSDSVSVGSRKAKRKKLVKGKKKDTGKFGAIMKAFGEKMNMRYGLTSIVEGQSADKEKGQSDISKLFKKKRLR